ncbi:hypothetical protein TSAR_014400 [Trichomalopsis sarcophagae]|uniref:Uncharacterized protein n=1 Tax=Trichomalopsis sarcophagae TaxID=543379 RepID=A0A232EFF8_9HYME|nr:hypothetical protein TSAR_014400 [Trichomalopsis sarcophagae]
MYSGHELLERAMECKNLDYLRLLLEADVNVNARNTFGSTALMYAVDRGNMPTPLERATRTKPEILELLLNYTHKTHNSRISEYLLKQAATAPHSYSGKNVELLLKRGYNVNSLSCNKRCPTVGAIVHQNNEALRILIKYKANSKITSSKGENALYIAVRFGTIQAVEMILETGECDINEVSSSSVKPL